MLRKELLENQTDGERPLEDRRSFFCLVDVRNFLHKNEWKEPYHHVEGRIYGKQGV